MNNQINEKQILEAVMKVLGENKNHKPQNNNTSILTESSKNGDLIDITEIDLRKELLIDHPQNGEMYLRLKGRRPQDLALEKRPPL